MKNAWITAIMSAVALALIAPSGAAAHDPPYTRDFDKSRCTFTTTGSNPYFPLWPGYVLTLMGEEEDDEGNIVMIDLQNSVLTDTELVDGVLTRVYEERESEDGELVEVSRNFHAICRETGDVWYFGEDVDDYEDGEIVGHEGAWRAGENGNQPGIIMPGNPLIGARHFTEYAPGVAEDFIELVDNDVTLMVPAGTFEKVLYFQEGSGLDPMDFSEKWFVADVGIIKDDEVELVSITPPPCLPDATTHCLNDGRFRVQADWGDFQANEGVGMAILPSDDSGEFWFFDPNNSELFVKVLDACSLPDFNSFWVFAAGLTNVEVTLTVTDTATGQIREYENPLGMGFEPVLDTSAFATCP